VPPCPDHVGVMGFVQIQRVFWGGEMEDVLGNKSADAAYTVTLYYTYTQSSLYRTIEKSFKFGNVGTALIHVRHCTRQPMSQKENW